MSGDPVRTLAIEKRSSEVWEPLGAVKTEFRKYADVLAKVRRKLNEAQTTIDEAETRTRVIRRSCVTLKVWKALQRYNLRPMQMPMLCRSW